MFLNRKFGLIKNGNCKEDKTLGKDLIKLLN